MSVIASIKASEWSKPHEHWLFTRFVYRSFMENNGLESAKSMTYTSLFAVVPLFTLTAIMLAAVPAFQTVGTQVQDVIFSSLLPSSSLQVQEYIETFSGQARNLTWVGILMLVVTAYLMLVNIERSFNQIWGIGEQRKGLASFLLYWSVLTLSPLLLGLGFAATAFVTGLSLFQRFTEVTDIVGATHLALSVIPVALTTLAFTLLYVAVPNCGVRIRHAVVGGLVVALSFVIARKAFMFIMSRLSFEFIYGSFAALPVFLIWIYLSWVVIFIGANLVRCLPLFHREKNMVNVHPSILIMALLHNFWSAHQRGEGVRIQELMTSQWPFKSLKLDDYIEFLVEQRLIRAVDQDEYLLVRDLKGVHFWELMEKLPWARVTLADLERPVPDVLKPHLPGFERWKEKIARVELNYRETFGESLDDFLRSSEPGLKAVNA